MGWTQVKGLQKIPASPLIKPIPTVKPKTEKTKKTGSAYDTVTKVWVPNTPLPATHAGTLQLIASDVQRCLVKRLLPDVRMVLPNWTPRGWGEMDVMAVLKSGYTSEFEIKVSMSDYMADFKKTVSTPAGEKRKHDQLRDRLGYPNRFWFVMPASLGEFKLPEYAGLLVVRADNKGRTSIMRVRRAPLLHKEKRLDGRAVERIARNYLYRYNRLRFQ